MHKAIRRLKAKTVELRWLAVLLGFLYFSESPALQAQTPDSLEIYGAPVVFLGDTLFTVYRKIGAFSSGQRARIIASQVAELQKLPRNELDSLTVIPDDSGGFRVVFRDQVVNSISAEDAQLESLSAEAMARRNLQRIRSALIAEHEDQSLISLAKDLGIFLALLVVLILVWSAINRVFDFLKIVLQQRLKTFLAKQYVGGNAKLYRLVNARAQLNVLVLLLRLLRIATLFLLLYLFLPFLFSQLSYTRGFGESLLAYVLTPLQFVWIGLVGFIPDFIFIIIIIWLGIQLIKVVGWLAERVQSGEISIDGFYADWAKPTANLLRALVVVFTLIMIFPLLPGSNSDAFKGISVFIGLMLSLGGASAVGNAVSGIILTYMRPFQVGHRVKIGDTVGDIVSKNLLVTRIRTTKNEEITVPNGNLLSGGIVNYTALADSVGLVLHTSITIGYDVPWIQVHQLMLTAAAKTEFIEATPEPFVLQKALQDWYVEYELNAYTRNSHAMPRIYSELHANIQDAFRDADVEIMSPHYMALRKGDDSTIPGAMIK